MKSFNHAGHTFQVSDDLHTKLLKNMQWYQARCLNALRGHQLSPGKSYLHGVVCQCAPDCPQTQVLVNATDVEGFLAKLNGEPEPPKPEQAAPRIRTLKDLAKT